MSYWSSLLGVTFYSASIHDCFSVACLTHAAISRACSWLALRKQQSYMSFICLYTFLYVHKRLSQWTVLSLGILMLLLGPCISQSSLINKLNLYKDFSCFLVKMFYIPVVYYYIPLKNLFQFFKYVILLNLMMIADGTKFGGWINHASFAIS